MTLKSLCISLAMVALLVSACASEPEPAPAAEPEMAAEPVASADPLSGTWTGDWGPSATDRNAVTVELEWDGSTLSGTVNPGPDGVPLSVASFDPATNQVRMEADVESARGPFHYMIDGTLEGSTISGSWGHDDVSGDFAITMD